MNYIVLDLEWNQAVDRNNEIHRMPFEVIEIGAVKMDESGTITDEYDCLIRPVVYPELHFRVRELVGVSQKKLEEEGLPFAEGFHAFMEWCGEDAVFCTWGGMDLTELQKNVDYFGLENPFPKPLFFYDVQKLYSLQYGDGKKRLALEVAVDEMGFRTGGEKFHRAISDAYYTALMLGAVDRKKLKKMVSVDYYRLPQTKEEEIYLVFDGYSKFVSCPYESREEAMKQTQVTSTVCYKCGRNVRRRINWFSDTARHSYALSYCPVHGWLKGKIRVKKVPDSEKIFIVKTLKLVDSSVAADIVCRQEDLRTRRREKARASRKEKEEK